MVASFVRHLCWSERRQLASATFKLHGQEFVSGDIFNGFPGKYVIAEVERRFYTSELRNGTGWLRVAIFEGPQDIVTSDKTRKRPYRELAIFWPTSRHFNHILSWDFLAILSTLYFGSHLLLVYCKVFYSRQRPETIFWCRELSFLWPSSRHVWHLHSWNLVFWPHQLLDYIMVATWDFHVPERDLL